MQVSYCDNPDRTRLDLSEDANQLRLVNTPFNQHIQFPASHRVDVVDIIPSIQRLIA